MTHWDIDEVNKNIDRYIKQHMGRLPKTDAECLELSRQLIAAGILPPTASEINRLTRKQLEKQGKSYDPDQYPVDPPMPKSSFTNFFSTPDDPPLAPKRKKRALDPDLYDIDPLSYDPAEVESDLDDEDDFLKD